MTSEEIKERVSIRDVLTSYGVKIRGNMCSCPFHKDRDPSMAIYENSVKCFSCGFSGDIFSLTQKMDNCSFKEAFLSLGGTYGHMSHRSRIVAETKREARKRERERAEQKERDFRKTLEKALLICENANKVYEPYSDEWCYLLNKLPYLRFSFDEKYINGNEVNEGDVYRLSRNINGRFLYRA